MIAQEEGNYQVKGEGEVGGSFANLATTWRKQRKKMGKRNYRSQQPTTITTEKKRIFEKKKKETEREGNEKHFRNPFISKAQHRVLRNHFSIEGIRQLAT